MVTMVTIEPMIPAIDVEQVIRALGGPAKVAELCGIGTVQAVSMWLVRKKIPPARLMYLKAIRPDVFEKGSPVDMVAAEKAAA